MPTPNRASQPVFEPLDPRRLCSAKLDHGVLTIEGTRRADAIVVALKGDTTLQVTINGRASTFPRVAVSRLQILTGQGADVVSLFDRDPAVALDALVSGGAGNDSVVSGGGNDTLLGDEGDDTLRGGAGRDRVRGGGGKDYLFGDGGRDLLYGEGSNDSLHGGTEADLLDGGRGNDQLHGGGHRDSIYGGAGADTFYRADRSFQFEQFLDAGRGESVLYEPQSIPGPMGGSYGGALIGQTITWTPTPLSSIYTGGGYTGGPICVCSSSGTP